MSMYFIKPGLQTSIQDLGRYGQMHNGISISGAMDPIALKKANWLLNKKLDSAVIEITLIGPTIRFESDMLIAICGANFELSLNNKAIFNDQIIHVCSGDILMFGKLLSGSRAYMSYSLSSNLPKVLGSFSTHLTANFGGFFGRQFKAGDKLFLHTGENKNAAYRTISEQYQINYSRSYLLRCVSSVESELFSDVQKTSFLNKKYTVSKNSNRMGIRLSDIAMKFISPINIVSSGLTQGSIQITPSGHAIISSVDGQTIGGYPRIANVISADLPILGQLKAKDKINFLFVSHQKAQQIFIEQNKILNTLFEEPEFQIS